ncbi:MAG: hypothetical protein Ta2E_10970 [Mycoplasmoidaceae bacterium]|nr:MAG: hypothetical protein Ta2E_10970 [Mycoplasmoidaceae bacterium]
MKDKLKKVIKTIDQRDSFLEYNKPVWFGYHKRWSAYCYNVYFRKNYDINFVNVLYGVQMRSMAKSAMYSYFDYCDKNNIRVCYCHTDTMLIKESDLDMLKHFIQMNTVN